MICILSHRISQVGRDQQDLTGQTPGSTQDHQNLNPVSESIVQVFLGEESFPNTHQPHLDIAPWGYDFPFFSPPQVSSKCFLLFVLVLPSSFSPLLTSLTLHFGNPSLRGRIFSGSSWLRFLPPCSHFTPPLVHFLTPQPSIITWSQQCTMSMAFKLTFLHQPQLSPLPPSRTALNQRLLDCPSHPQGKWGSRKKT